ncbi:PEGA domain-containing protein [Patescibacteria group bacterium]|nr:PEGA domain-containing protein [Patescibacteria group bacterium]
MIKKIGLLILSSIVLSACTIPFFGNKAGVQITSNPQGMVTINSESSGQTPVYQENLKAGSYAVKISPLDTTLQPWEGKITLTAGTITAVDRQLAVSPDQAHGHTLYFEKLDSKDKVEVNITSLPNTVSVLIDGNPAGFTPFSSSSIDSGGHTFTLTAPGFQDKVIKAAVESGFRLNINAQLAGQKIADLPTPTPTPEQATPSATPTPKTPTDITPLPKQSTSSAVPKPYVEIDSATLGWLRVRQEPEGVEIAKVNHGDKFPYLKTQSGWYQIEYQTSKNGWISASYATLFE